jgi:hypothetical protein
MKARHRRGRQPPRIPHATAFQFKAAAAASQGRRHEADGVECQDAIARSAKGRHIAIALCDGAGSARLSARGAAATADATVRHLLVHFDDLVAGGLPRASLSITENLQRTLRRVAQRHSARLEDLACTLLFAVTDGACLLFGQLGDGRVGVRDAETGSWRPVLTASKGEFLNETTFVTSRRAKESLQLGLEPASRFTACMLMSDGAEESLFNRATQTLAPAVETIAGWVASHPTAKVEAALRQQLQTLLRAKTFDDVAIACISRPPNKVKA